MTNENKGFGQHFNGQEVLYFESDSEATAFYEALKAEQPAADILLQWERTVVEPAVRAFIEEKIRPKPLDYTSINEPNTWVNDADYSIEAQEVVAWICACWKNVTQQIEMLEQPIDVEVIIQNLPEFIL